jgi:hypothetical protein
MNGLLLRLYPGSWRARYGDEFEALLEERPLGPFDVADVLLSALDAHLRRGGAAATGDHFRGVRMTLRNGGIAAIAGGGLWLISLAGASATQGAPPWIALFVFALCALVVAIIGLSAEQGRRRPSLIWIAVALPVIGAVLSVVGLIGMATTGDEPFVAGVSAWNVWALGSVLVIIGSGVFAVASLRVRTLSRGGTTLLAVGALTAVASLLGIAFVEAFGDSGSRSPPGGSGSGSARSASIEPARPPCATPSREGSNYSLKRSSFQGSASLL